MAAIVMLGLAPAALSRQSAPLTTALTFYAPFDGGTTAASALGDPELYSAPSRKDAASATRGLADGVQIVRGEGRHGDALRLRLKSSPFVFFKGAGNIAYGPRNWSGTISFWMNLDPDEDLLPGYSDPLIVTPRAWNDAALFVDFTRDDVPRRFRFAAFADRDVWDPARREWEAVPVAERPMVEITGKRFARGKWTHVAWTWERFNTGQADGTLTCYLDGLPVGTLANRRQTFTWSAGRCVHRAGRGVQRSDGRTRDLQPGTHSPGDGTAGRRRRPSESPRCHGEVPTCYDQPLTA